MKDATNVTVSLRLLSVLIGALSYSDPGLLAQVLFDYPELARYAPQTSKDS